jgi:hypothetical protein
VSGDAAQHACRDAEGIAGLDHVVDFGLAELIDDPAGFERIDCRFFAVTDLAEQRRIAILRVGDGRFGDAAAELLDDYLPAALALRPLRIGWEADSDGLQTFRGMQVDGDRAGRVENRSCRFHEVVPYWQI